MAGFSDKKTSKNIVNYECKNCDFKCCKSGDWNRHIMRAKHIKLTNSDAQVTQKTPQYICEICEKKYNSRNGLWVHKKKCIDETSVANLKNDLANEEKCSANELGLTDKELINILVQQNQKLMNLVENGTNINTTNNTTNSHNTTNNAFNLNFFLNETCKDAMNIDEFVSSIKVNLSDLENTGRQGYIEGISNIILKNLNNLEQNFRPLHCSDSKREVFYIKDNNEWQKENQEKPILTKAIKVIANENIKQIKHWRDKYPDCTDADSKKNNLYLKIVSNSMNGSTQEESIKNIDKIISNVAKEVIIDKTNL